MTPEVSSVRVTDLSRRGRVANIALGAFLLCVTGQPAAAQQSITDVLSFLVTNRSIATDDFVRDEQAAAATRDTIAEFLVLELATLPIASSAGGFTYRLDPALGTVVRSSDSFGPIFIERSLTSGKSRASFGVSYRSSTFGNIDGRDLRDGTLVSTASTLRGEPQPFDIETLSLRIRADSMTVSGAYGVTDELDVSVAVPFVRLSLRGERIDTYRGREFFQAGGSAVVSGLGDVALRTKYTVLRLGASGFAVGAEARLPTGDEEDLLGAGRASVKPRAIGSFESARIGLHADVGYSFGGIADELQYGGAITVVALPRLTVIGEVAGRRIDGVGQLADTTEPHPRLSGVDTIRLTSVRGRTDRVVASAGFKWNVAGSWLVAAHVVRPLTTAGLNAEWVPTVTFDYSFRR